MVCIVAPAALLLTSPSGSWLRACSHERPPISVVHETPPKPPLWTPPTRKPRNVPTDLPTTETSETERPYG